MKFQIYDKNGRISKDHDQIAVEWDSPSRKNGFEPIVVEREVYGIYQHE